MSKAHLELTDRLIIFFGDNQEGHGRGVEINNGDQLQEIGVGDYADLNAALLDLLDQGFLAFGLGVTNGRRDLESGHRRIMRLTPAGRDQFKKLKFTSHFDQDRRMDNPVLHSVLRRVGEGQRTFSPVGSSTEHIHAFQEEARALVHAHEERLIRQCSPHIEKASGLDLYDTVIVGGLTHRGELALTGSARDMPATKPLPSTVRVFISHSSHDNEVVSALIDLLRSALQIRAAEIRCTSVDGYRLPAGADTDDQLRDEVHQAEIFVGVISAHSMKSIYVVFELGARWATDKPLIPLLVSGMQPTDLERPLDRLNAIRCDSREHLHQLIRELGEKLGIAPEGPDVYERNITALLTIKPAKASATKNTKESSDVSDLEVETLQAIVSWGGREVRCHDIAEACGRKVLVVEHAIDKLLAREFIIDHYFANARPRYSLHKRGRAYLVEKGLIK